MEKEGLCSTCKDILRYVHQTETAKVMTFGCKWGIPNNYPVIECNQYNKRKYT